MKVATRARRGVHPTQRDPTLERSRFELASLVSNSFLLVTRPTTREEEERRNWKLRMPLVIDIHPMDDVLASVGSLWP